MGDVVKRKYRSGLRAAQADDTRRAIVAAAARLFVDEGYGATTIDAVAEASGVSRKTVFTAVGGKVALLKTALDWAIAGDDRPLAVADRPALRDLLAGADAVEMLAGWAHFLVEVDSRVSDLFRALEIAADCDDEARQLLDASRRQRVADARIVVGRIVQLGALNTTLSRARAVDVAWLATDPVLFDRLVRNRGWTAKTFEAWLRRSLAEQLLNTPS